MTNLILDKFTHRLRTIDISVFLKIKRITYTHSNQKHTKKLSQTLNDEKENIVLPGEVKFLVTIGRIFRINEIKITQMNKKNLKKPKNKKTLNIN